jgi:hypothetical protein
MKYVTYLAISIMIIAIISLFYIKKPDGQPWLSSSSITYDSTQLKNTMIVFSTKTLDQSVQGIKKVTDKVTSRLSSESLFNGKIYKWQDERGQWVFSDTPNPHGQSVEVRFDPKKITVIPAQNTSNLGINTPTSDKTVTAESPTIFNPGSIKKLFEDTENVKEKLEKRNKEINNLSVL